MNMTGFDLGVVSFLTTFLSSAYLLTERGKRPTKITRGFVLLSHLFVVGNYALGVLFSFTVLKDKILTVFGTYCALFTIIWMGSAYLSW
eukprot:CAMPEP_0195527866 /NCGR_PEP_ID=MMETSP0794_2-20130614/29773_1 /TAXON_ID=515487 /ORGANISM="Stephanopyxis turris, Strain CCMP 815" /LENGTH=88 /DNA_ID=CAMNT_0040658875 /DNA_START=300 /DNA_END=563 /DNA_ORIENTATION=+